MMFFLKFGIEIKKTFLDFKLISEIVFSGKCRN